MKRKEKGLGAFQLTMLALGTVIGGSFFLGSSVAIHAAGPSIMISYGIGGLLVYFILSALSELTVASPDAGSFRSFAAKEFGPGTGFVVGWVYWTGMVLAMSSEATAISILVRNWYPNVSVLLLGSGIIIGVTLINLIGAAKLSNLESTLASVKIIAIIGFILLAIGLTVGLVPRHPAMGLGALSGEQFFPGGIKSIAGSMLIVLFAYAGFEIIGLASAETAQPKKAVPKAIRYTVFSLVGLYILSTVALLPLISTGDIGENASPFVAALNKQGFIWAGTVLNIVLISAILSTMLAAMFGLGRMMRSLANEGHAPRWMKDSEEVPKRGIIMSGLCMLLALWFGMLLPSVYVFLISSGGFAILFTYAVLMATHIRFRKRTGLQKKSSRERSYPYSSLFTLIALIAVVISMPFVKGQESGLIAGGGIVAFFAFAYQMMKQYQKVVSTEPKATNTIFAPGRFQTELSEELTDSEWKPKEDSGEK
jgi:L-asparagine transporter-like permease